MSNNNPNQESENVNSNELSQSDLENVVGGVTGTVSTFDPQSGVGFLILDDDKTKVMVTRRSSLVEGLTGLAKGQKVEFDIATEAFSGHHRLAINVHLK